MEKKIPIQGHLAKFVAKDLYFGHSQLYSNCLKVSISRNRNQLEIIISERNFGASLEVVGVQGCQINVNQSFLCLLRGVFCVNFWSIKI